MSGVIVKQWRRYGQDLLYANDAETGEKVAAFDRKTGRIEVADENREAEVFRALRPFLADALASSIAEQLLVGAPAPGSGSAQSAPVAPPVAVRPRGLGPSGLRRVAVRLLHRPPPAASRETGAKAERIVGARLDRLRRDGWGVLQPTGLRGGADIDHIVIGPPGVFTINTRHHKDAHIKVGDRVVWVNGSEKRDYIRDSIQEADSAARRLTRACGMPVKVTAMLAFVAAARLSVISTGASVLVGHGEDVDRVLRSLPGVLTMREREHILRVARDAALWLV